MGTVILVILLIFGVPTGLLLLWGVWLDHIKERDRSRATVAPPKTPERQKQLDALGDATPKTPVDRMRATIQQNDFTDGLRKFAVDMILEVSEEERMVLLSNHLSEIVIEDEPAHTPAQIDKLEADLTAEAEARRGFRGNETVGSRLLANDLPHRVEEAKRKRRKVIIGDYLVRPYTRIFETPYEASDYAEKLKTDILPKIRKMIDEYASRKPAQTVQF